MGKSKINNIFSGNGLYYTIYYALRFTHLDYLLPDKTFLKLKYRCYTGRKLNLNPPVLYTEKLQWLKLYNRNQLLSKLVDKYEVKDYVSKMIGEQYVIPTIGVWNKVEDIDFQSLPNQFVLKCTHDSGGLVICRDKSKLDIIAAKKKLRKSLKNNFYMAGREWPYKNVPRRIIAEEYMEDQETGELRDYKFFCFDGDAKILFVATDRQNREEPFFDFYDMNYKHLNIRSGHPNANIPPAKPKNFELMKELASRLSKGFSHVRVDFYEVNGRVYFGEMTFFHHTGMVLFEPEEWNKTFGDWIKLTNID